MPSFANDIPYQSQTATAPSSHPHSFDSPQGKRPEKASVGNTFLWTNWPNGDSSHLNTPPNERPYLTNGSAYSLHPPRSSVSSYTRELPQSKDGSLHSLNGSPRDPRDGGRPSISLDRDFSRRSLDAGGGAGSAAASVTSQPVNGTPIGSRSLNGKPMVNGDHARPSVDEVATQPDSARPSTSQLDEAGRLSPDPDRLSPSQNGPNRYSSPPIPPSMEGANQLEGSSSSLRHRHTLQVPRNTSGRRSSRDHGEDAALATGRLSPTSGNIRRTSLSLGRRASRTNRSESFPDEATPDEDAARWAEAIKQRRASRKRRRDDDDDDRVIVGTKVDQNHVNWVTAYNMLTGIRFTVSRINAKMDRELTPADFQAKHKFSFDITGNELTPSAKYDFKFKDYAPWVFRRLRAKFRLDPADYLMSLTSKYILSELGSPGKSGSFFYFSRDYKYIIKTIHHSEHKLLRKILPEYYKHVEKNPNTLISQFYGLHRVKMAYGRKIHFVVMNNLFPPHRDIHETFDLKGSTIGRDLHEEDLVKNPRATMKDLNWVRRNRHLECGPQKREFFVAQLERDVELLKKLKIMDYSLLVGIHDIERGNEEKLRDKTLQVFQPGGDRDEDSNPNMLMRTPSKLENERKARELRMLIKRERPVPLDKATAKMPEEILDERKFHVFYSDDGGFRATHESGQPGEEIYYLGIIDCLTHYGTVKKIEHFFKGLSHDRAQISPVPPEGYGDRFIHFIKGITMSKEEAERVRESRALGRPSVERSSSVERTMLAAEREAAKEGTQTLAHPRTISTMRDPADTPGSGPASMLPIVDEAGEASSVGGHSQHSRHGPTADKDLPPLPAMEKGKHVAMDGPRDSYF
ncbi:phosphatidylinositol-4-phosphate 5-kinase its3 [Aspergillus campestris IBT 28561]|uniref:1-phosphatidylinositol-4-phosphate 5-kinase n=1 Tax=Aspergillus campestris (strain IBT 28561) TaxID=1392248 RepID=A0A2I1DCZ0_ASPC2|nr:phosphatidylinositol-4-phosphate 5-kinase its3 [Aspergillus campestris IBT 28561]PKY07749.1 phosphatidylinositol-4-phosphate 5-kinase its3 [Aspergillus campestris IBT 28561]